MTADVGTPFPGQIKIALVTGGMGGIGEAISVALHDAGYITVVTCSPQNREAVAWLSRMRESGRLIHGYPADVSSYESCAQCAARIRTDIGSVDILVNNAGITRDATLRKLDHASWDSVLRTNLDSVYNMSRQWCDGMIEKQWGRIVNIASVIGSKGGFGQTNYAAAKAGIHGFTKSLALELAHKGVTVNTVSPGYIATRMVRAVSPEILRTRILPDIPVGRLGEPEEVAHLVRYLVSREAGFITGANMAINGGQHLY
ncbi:acetoacetyl-CoA reductase [Burkholderia ambifaria]|uniref:acetoacetyl-CoA reductase n=1 Tax=Burkholderia ambifaria TaxID=152480 RepID=UPI001590BCB6|nr:acetoacetyl-CoA reductase [Burkholderia ambifaria]